MISKTMQDRAKERERITKAILNGLSMDIDDEFLEAPKEADECALAEIKQDTIAQARRVIDALTFDELCQEGALSRFAETTAQQVRHRLHLLDFELSRKRSGE